MGLRPGEKLDEELLFEHEVCQRTAHPKIMCVQGKGAGTIELLAGVEKLTDLAVRMDFSGIRKETAGLVPEFVQGRRDRPSVGATVMGSMRRTR